MRQVKSTRQQAACRRGLALAGAPQVTVPRQQPPRPGSAQAYPACNGLWQLAAGSRRDRRQHGPTVTERPDPLVRCAANRPCNHRSNTTDQAKPLPQCQEVYTLSFAGQNDCWLSRRPFGSFQPVPNRHPAAYFN